MFVCDSWFKKAAATGLAAAVTYYFYQQYNTDRPRQHLAARTTPSEPAAGEEVKSLFQQAVEYLRNLTNSGLSTDQQLEFYGLYKQTVVGDCDQPQPSMIEFAAAAKWKAWSKLKGMDKATAEEQYIELLSKTFPDWRSQNAVSQPADGDGPSRPQGNTMNIGSVTSTTQFSEGCTTIEEENENWKVGTDVFYLASVGDLDGLVGAIKANGTLLDSQDDVGRTPLHWACDRGYDQMATTLLELGANMEVTDADGLTALGYAVNCENEAVVKLLVAKGANIHVEDEDGDTPVTMANKEIKKILLADNQ